MKLFQHQASENKKPGSKRPDWDVPMGKTAEDITQNPTTPQYWDKDALQSKVIKDSGVGSLIQEIWDRRVERLDDDRIESIARWVRNNSVLFQQAFKVSNISNVSDRKLVYHLLTFGELAVRSSLRRGLTAIDLTDDHNI